MRIARNLFLAASMFGGVLTLCGPDARAQTPEIMLGGDAAIWGDPNAVLPGDEPENYLAKCLANPGDRISCQLARTNERDGGLESALNGQLETVIIDYSAGETPKVTRNVDASAPATTPSPSFVASTEPQPQPPSNLTMLEANVFFQYNSTAFAPGEEAKVNQLAAALSHELNRDNTFLIVGHTDSKGSDTYNCDLSARRSEAMVAALIVRGVASDKLVSVGAGEKILKDANNGHSPENRRVGFARLGADAARIVAGMRRFCR